MDAAALDFKHLTPWGKEYVWIIENQDAYGVLGATWVPKAGTELPSVRQRCVRCFLQVSVNCEVNMPCAGGCESMMIWTCSACENHTTS